MKMYVVTIYDGPLFVCCRILAFENQNEALESAMQFCRDYNIQWTGMVCREENVMLPVTVIGHRSL